MSQANDRNGIGLGDEQIQRAAAQAVEMVSGGVRVNQAMTAAMETQIAKMQSLSDQLRQQYGQIGAMQARG